MAERLVSGNDIRRHSSSGKIEMTASYISIWPKAIEAVISTVNRKHQLAKVVSRRIH
jgi:hypothetical protein